MNRHLLRTYQKVRKAGVACIVGQSAAGSLQIARTLEQFDTLESAGLVRIECQPDDSPDLSYIDTWEHMSTRSKEQLKERLWNQGIVGVIGQYRVDSDSPWETGDSIWGCAGYKDPASPFENCYISDIMAQTISSLRAALKDRFCERCGHRLGYGD